MARGTSSAPGSGAVRRGAAELHFAATESPDLLVADIQSFFKQLRER
jgi:hypothetical protein